MNLQNIELKKLAVIDANINRVGEGLRVIEDWARFIMREESLTAQIRKLRHGLWKVVEKTYPEIIKGRDTSNDMFSENKEMKRKKAQDIPKASFNRVKEGLRVLEEMGKLISSDASLKFKKMRFEAYNIERKFYD